MLDQGDVDLLVTTTDAFRKDRATAAIFLNKGEPFAPGKRLVQTDLAKTLRAISARGADGFYKGAVGAAIVASSKAGKGIITQADLDQYRTRELAPVECDYRGYRIVSAPPPSSGGVIICEILNVLEGYPLKDWGFRSAQAVHVQIEAMRHAYLDRNSYLGDPDFVKNPLDRLLDKGYAEKIRGAIDPKKAGVSKELKPGVAPHEPMKEGSNTTHYSIVDKAGNAVSVTYTLNDWFGAKVTAAGTGVLLNDEMDDFTAKVGVPNLYGLVQGAANSIAPGKRPLSSMSPTIVTKDGKPVMVVGTPGGSRIITAVLHTIVNVIEAWGLTGPLRNPFGRGSQSSAWPRRSAAPPAMAMNYSSSSWPSFTASRLLARGTGPLWGDVAASQRRGVHRILMEALAATASEPATPRPCRSLLRRSLARAPFGVAPSGAIAPR